MKSERRIRFAPRGTVFEQSILGTGSYTIGFTLSTVDGILPLKKVSIPYLEITDDIAHLGDTGIVTFNTPDNFLSKTEFISLLNKCNTYFSVYIEQNDAYILDIPEDQKIISFTAQLQQSLQKSRDTTENPFTFSFEEDFVAALKQEVLDPETTRATSLGEALVDVVTSNKTRNYSERVTVNTAGITPAEKVVGTKLESDSRYDYIIRLLRAALYNNTEPVYLHVTNEEGERVIELYSLAEKIKSTCELIRQNNFSSVYEIFTTKADSSISPTGPVLRENIIDEYTLYAPDYFTLLDEKWINFRVMSSTRDGVSLGSITYNDLYDEFKVSVCGNNEPSLPLPSEITEKRKFNVLESQYGVVNDINIIKSAVFKSFMFDNTTISFRTPGAPWRKSGEFIIINGVDGNSFNSELDGLWYIVSIKHILEQETYTNEIIATRFVSLNK
jgi:hypothetical protein